ncbi:unnamed protein product [Cuscuta campestris]|uniref:Uncharacterized protein n=1 Tax=Cuscuta campestris TaxID=132261 RepID=A0A484MX83_9ASTE|nr:unnamed protein product [Cuscuta campestris]
MFLMIANLALFAWLRWSRVSLRRVRRSIDAAGIYDMASTDAVQTQRKKPLTPAIASAKAAITPLEMHVKF